MPNLASEFDRLCQRYLKISGRGVLIILTVLIIIAVIAIIVIHHKKSKRESYTTSTVPTTGFKDELQKCIQKWNSAIDSYYGIRSNKDGFTFSKFRKSEPYERTRLANDFEYLKRKETK